MTTLTQARLHDLLNYAAETGVFTWKRPRLGMLAGAVAGYLRADGYREIKIDRRAYLAHRLAWLHTHGHWPAVALDHINGQADDNRLSNLREATLGQNQQNRKLQISSTSGCVGVTWHKKKQRWQARIYLDRTEHYLGLFATKEDAVAAYAARKSQLHAFHPDMVTR